jgi:hypothetical protein
MGVPLAERNLMAVEIIPVWKRVDPELQAELARYWIDNGAMQEEGRAAQRAKEVACIARKDGKIVGVTTAYPKISGLLRQPMYFLGMHIAKPARNEALSIPFLKASFAEIEKQELEKEKPMCLGVMLLLQNERLAQQYNEAFWWQSKFVFAGYGEKDQQARVRFFEGAKLGPPMVPRKAKAPASAA